MAPTEIWRCSAGHLYSASKTKTVLRSLHLGVGKHFQRCPVDGRWRLATRVDPAQLSEQERGKAAAQTF